MSFPMPLPGTYQARWPRPWQSPSSAWCCWALHCGWRGSVRKSRSGMPLMVIVALTADSPAEHPGTILTITLPKRIPLKCGFAGTNCTPGTWEYLQFWINYGAGWQDAGTVGVNVHDLPAGKPSGSRSRRSSRQCDACRCARAARPGCGAGQQRRCCRRLAVLAVSGRAGKPMAAKFFLRLMYLKAEYELRTHESQASYGMPLVRPKGGGWTCWRVRNIRLLGRSSQKGEKSDEETYSGAGGGVKCTDIPHARGTCLSGHWCQPALVHCRAGVGLQCDDHEDGPYATDSAESGHRLLVRHHRLDGSGDRERSGERGIHHEHGPRCSAYGGVCRGPIQGRRPELLSLRPVCVPPRSGTDSQHRQCASGDRDLDGLRGMRCARVADQCTLPPGGERDRGLPEQLDAHHRLVR